MYSSPMSGSPSDKKSSLIHVCKLKRLRKNGKFKVEAVDGAEIRHEAFMWKFFSTLNQQTSHDRSGVSREDLNSILLSLYPTRKYRTYYNSIIKVTMRPKRLF